MPWSTPCCPFGGMLNRFNYYFSFNNNRNDWYYFDLIAFEMCLFIILSLKLFVSTTMRPFLIRAQWTKTMRTMKIWIRFQFPSKWNSRAYLYVCIERIERHTKTTIVRMYFDGLFFLAYCFHFAIQGWRKCCRSTAIEKEIINILRIEVYRPKIKTISVDIIRARIDRNPSVLLLLLFLFVSISVDSKPSARTFIFSYLWYVGGADGVIIIIH